MVVIKKIFGAPGTGKTTWIVSETRRLVERGEIDEAKILATSLTKATKWALVGKMKSEGVNIREENVRTLHSFCYRALKEKPELISQEALKYFFYEKGFEYKIEKEKREDEEFPLWEQEAHGNKLYQAFNKVRLTWDGVDNVRQHLYAFYEKEKHELGLSFQTFLKLFKDYIDFLKKNKLYDFTRLLTEAYKSGAELKGDLLILDEFQDKGNLHVAIVEKWLKNFKYVLIAGDDDQAIFTFAGSNPDHLIRISANETVILPKSYRLPYRIWLTAQELISQNKNRVFKDYTPSGEEGKVDWVLYRDEVLDMLGEEKETFILVRNKYFLEEWRKVMEATNTPYKIAGKRVSVPTVAKHIKTHLKLLNKEKVADEELYKFLIYIKPLIRDILRKRQIREVVVDKIAKKIKARNFSEAEGQVAFYILNHEPEDVFIEDSREVVEKWKTRARELEKWEKPLLTLATIHSAKGLEAERVFLDTRITKKVLMSTIEDPEIERRVLYVGITRAKRELYFVKLPKSYTYQNIISA